MNNPAAVRSMTDSNSSVFEFSLRTRQESIPASTGKIFDFFIVGGGINGAGICNLISANGRSVFLSDKGDFAAGTSSGSSKLIHGGLRYLANFEFREVRNLLKERNYLLKNVDFVKPLDFSVLVDEYSWRKVTLRLGLFLYNLLGGKLKIPKYHRNSGEFPKGIRGYFSYLDSATDDAFLVISNIVTSQMQGAVCVNYSMVNAIRRSGEIWEVSLEDLTTGRSFTIRSKVLINAAGPWAGDILTMLNGQRDGRFKLSKGIHIVVPSSLYGRSSAVVFRSHIDRRQMFIIPRGEVTHIGTTDTFTESSEDWKCLEDEIDYVVKSAARIIPELNRDHVINCFTGIRPLYGGGEDPGSVTRKSEISWKDGVLSILGGKITDFRITARHVAKLLNSHCGSNLHMDGLPEIKYHRDSSDIIDQAIMRECAVTVEDILRRRTGSRVFSLDLGRSIEKTAESRLQSFKSGIPTDQALQK